MQTPPPDLFLFLRWGLSIALAILELPVLSTFLCLPRAAIKSLVPLCLATGTVLSLKKKFIVYLKQFNKLFVKSGNTDGTQMVSWGLGSQKRSE